MRNERVLAERLMGPNFFGPDDWKNFFGADFSRNQPEKSFDLNCGGLIREILQVQCPFEPGKRIKDTHFLFLGVDILNGEALTVMKFHELYPDNGKKGKIIFKYSKEPWYFHEDFAQKTVCRFGWRLAYLNLLPGSFNRGYEVQSNRVKADFPSYSIPLIIEEMSAMILFFEKNGIRLNKGEYGRCSDYVGSKNSALIGGFGVNGFSINKCAADYPFPTIGIPVFHQIFPPNGRR